MSVDQQRLLAIFVAVLVVCASLILASRHGHHAASAGAAISTTPATPAPAPSLPKLPAPDRGWSWSVLSPGYHLTRGRNPWNTIGLTQRDVPAGAGVLADARALPNARADVLYSAKGCIGVQLREGPRQLLCPPHAAAVIIADAHAIAGQGKPFYGIQLIGVVRSDVVRVTVKAPGERYVDGTTGTRVIRQMPAQNVYTAAYPGPWGSFQLSTGQPTRWDAIVTVYGKNGRLATLQIRPTKAGDALYCAGPHTNAC